MSSKKRYVTEEEVYAIGRGRISNHKENALAHQSIWWVLMFILYFVVMVIPTIMIYHYYFAVQGVWQPINCVNETKYIQGECIEWNYTDIHVCVGFTCDENETFSELFSDLNCFMINDKVICQLREKECVNWQTKQKQVPTGRQICSQKMLVKNETSVRFRWLSFM